MTTYTSDPLAFGDQFTTRNRGIITEREQIALRAATILIAGCGSVGGAVVEPLARLGVLKFRLADPDVYDLTNMNRQACVLNDVGTSKVETLAQRLMAINPHIQVKTYPLGVTEDNLAETLAGVSVIFDGIDPEMSPWVKYQLHAEAAKLRIPVIAGADFGGKPTLYVFDYRKYPRAFYGRATEEAHREGRFRDMSRWLGYTHFPADFLPVMADRLASGEAWPQIAYCVAGMGALGSRVVLDLLVGRSVRHIVSIDLHQATRPRLLAAREVFRFPVAIVRTLAAANRYAHSGRPTPLPKANVRKVLPSDLSVVLEAARSAPSPHNIQPWIFERIDQNVIRVHWNRVRWLRDADPDARGVGYALGCAIEAMDYIARGDWQPNLVDGLMNHRAWYAGDFHLNGLRDDVLLARNGILRHRCTNRADFVPAPLDNTTRKTIQQAAAEFGVELNIVTAPQALEELAALAYAATRTQLGDPAYIDELWAWIRLGRNDIREANDGFLPSALGLDPASQKLFRLLQVSPGLRQKTLKWGLGHAMAQRTAAGLRNSGAVIALRTPMDTPASRLMTGRAMMRVWLHLTEAGYAVQPQHATLLDPGAMAATQAICARGSNTLVASLLRIGRARSLPQASRRLPLHHLVHSGNLHPFEAFYA